jgi:hypothetical protein
MTISAALRLQVRQRANFACEFCGVTETDSGGELTIDHYQPQSKGGSDDLVNLLYSCNRCNQYKADYWPVQPHDPVLWNPRQEPLAAHFLVLADGTLYPTTPIGGFTLRRLRLNRPPLLAHRLRRLARTEEQRLLQRYRELIVLLEQLAQQQAALLKEQRELLEEQRLLLALLLGDTDQ